MMMMWEANLDKSMTEKYLVAVLKAFKIWMQQLQEVYFLFGAINVSVVDGVVHIKTRWDAGKLMGSHV